MEGVKKMPMRPVIILYVLVISLLMVACLPFSLSEPEPEPDGAKTTESETMSQPTQAPDQASRTGNDSGSSMANKPASGMRKQYTSPPPMTIDPMGSYTATIRTNKGNIVVELLPGPAPKTVNNFVFLANEGFYDGTIFHRVIPDFMIQGGDPTGTGTSGPGYKFEDEINPMFVFDRAGILAMANAGPNTNGSQFFITTVATPHLNGAHTIFGRVVEGQTVTEAISVVPRGAGDKPNSPVIIEGIDIN